VKNRQKWKKGLPKFAGLTQNQKKKWSEHQIYQSKRKFSKKSMSSVKECIGAKNSYGGYPTEFAGSTQNPKKMIGTSNQPIRTKIFPRKVCLIS
jgi:hypothetical protein